MTEPGRLVYVFWHWKRPGIQSAEYEGDQRAFHATFAAHPPEGFLGSSSSAVAGAPWANGGDTAYEDRYVLHDAGALDALDRSVAAAPYQDAHQRAARGAAGGTAGLYRARLGAPLVSPRYAAWFAKAPGTGYDDLIALLAPLVQEGESVLWMRRMVLGPTPEFCLQSLVSPSLPPSLSPLALALQPVWPGPPGSADPSRSGAGIDLSRNID